MSVFEDITGLVAAADLLVYQGYAPTGAKLPYTVHRPLVLEEAAVVLDGSASVWDTQTTLYACAASPTASWNLAQRLLAALQGKYVGGTTLSTSVGYIGAQVEGHYESQVTVQLNQGGI